MPLTATKRYLPFWENLENIAAAISDPCQREDALNFYLLTKQGKG